MPLDLDEVEARFVKTYETVKKMYKRGKKKSYNARIDKLARSMNSGHAKLVGDAPPNSEACSSMLQQKHSRELKRRLLQGMDEKRRKRAEAFAKEPTTSKTIERKRIEAEHERTIEHVLRRYRR